MVANGVEVYVEHVCQGYDVPVVRRTVLTLASCGTEELQRPLDDGRRRWSTRVARGCVSNGVHRAARP